MFFIAMISFSSCDRSVLFEKNVELPENRWEEKNAIKFTVDTIFGHDDAPLKVGQNDSPEIQFSPTTPTRFPVYRRFV